MKQINWLLKCTFLLLLFSCSNEKEKAFAPKVTLKSYTDRTKSGTEQIIFEYEEKESGKSQKVTKVFDIEANNPFLSNDKVTITKDQGAEKYGQSEVSLFSDFKNSEYLINPVNEYMTDDLKNVYLASRVEKHKVTTCVIHRRSAGVGDYGGFINTDGQIQILDNKGEQLAEIYAPKGATSSAMTDDGKYLLITYGGPVGEGYQIFNQGFSLYRVADQQEVFQYDLKSTEWHLKPAVTREGMIFVAFSSSDDSYPDQYFVIKAQRRIYYHAKFSRELRLRLFKIDDKGFYSHVNGVEVFKPYSSFEKVAF